MPEITEIISQKAIDGIIQTDKAISTLDQQTQNFVKTVEQLSGALKKGDLTIKEVQKAQKQANDVTKNTIKLNQQLDSAAAALEKQRQRGLAAMAKQAEAIKKAGLATAKAAGQESLYFKELKKVEQQQKANATATEKAGLATAKRVGKESQYFQALKKTAAQQQKAQAKEREMNSAMKMTVKSEEDLIRQTNALVAARKKLDLTTSEGIAKRKEMTAQIAANTEKLKQYDAEIGRSQRNVGNYKSALGGLKSQIGGLIGMYVGVYGLISAIKSTITTTIQFEKTFKNVLTLLSDSDKIKFGSFLREGSIKIMSDFGFSIKDVNKALFDTISAGVPAADAIEFLRKASVLAIGGVTSLGTAVDGVTTIVNSYGLSMKDVSKVTAAFFSAQKFGKVTVEELNQEVGSSAPIAHAAGVSFQELLSIYAELTKEGIKATEATTAIKGIINAVIKPTQESEKVFKSLGIQVGLTAVRQQGLYNILVKVANATGDNADALTKLIPNRRALLGITALGTDALKDYDKILKTVNEDYGKNSSLTKAYGVQMDTFRTKIDQVKGAWRGLVLSVDKPTSSLGRALKDLLTDTKNFLNFLSMHKDIKPLEDPFKNLTPEQLNKKLVDLQASSKRITALISQEGERLKKLYGKDFTSFDDIIQKKEGAQLKYYFHVSAGIDAQIADIKKLTKEESKQQDKATEKLKEAEAQREHDRKESLKKTKDAEFQMFASTLDKQLKSIEVQAQAYRTAGVSEVKIAKWVNAQKEEIYQKANDKILADYDAQLKKIEERAKEAMKVMFTLPEEQNVSDQATSIAEDPQVVAQANRNREILALANKLSKDVVNVHNITIAEIDELEKHDVKNKEKYEALKTEIVKRNLKERVSKIEFALRTIQKAGNMIMESSMKTMEIQSNNLQVQNEKADAQLDDLIQKSKDRQQSEVDAAGNNQQKIAEINARYARQQKALQDQKAANDQALQKKQNEIRHKEDVAQKESALFNIALSTAQALIQLWVKPGFPAAIPMMAVVGGLGLLEAGLVLAEPLPQYYTGTDSAKGGVISVAERGRELVETKTGEKLLFDKPSLATGLEGAKIYTNEETERIFASAGKDDFIIRDEMRLQTKSITDAIRNKKEYTFDIQHGKITEREGNYFKEYLNRKIGL